MQYRFGRTLLFTIVTTLFLLSSFPTFAQDKLTEKYTFESGATFSYPEDWKLNKKASPLLLVSDQTQLFILDYADLQAIGVDTKNDAPEDVLKTYFTTTYPDRSFKATKIEDLEIGDRKGVQYDYSATDGRARVMVIPFTNKSAGIVEEISLAGKLHEEDTVLELVESFDNTEDVTAATNTTVVTQKVNCTVSTTRDDTVHVRVGPGENRTAIIFLSAGSSYKVIGQAKAKDGSLWWKLDKNEVAPDKAANEVWVKQDDVKSTGNCDLVTDVNAPPVVPIVNAPPTTNNGDSGSTSASSNPPQGGAWVISYGNGKASCFGTGTIDVAVKLPPEAISVSVSGSSINMGGDILRNTGGNTYQGIGQINDGGQNYSTNITVQVISGTQIVGSVAFTANYGDTSCSVTYPFNLNKS